MILLLGASGQLGTACRRLLGAQAVPLTRRELDFSDPTAIRPALAGYQPEAIINCAAYTAVDRAEDEEELAHRVNALAVGELAGWAAERQVPLVTFSTDYVFDGESDRPYVESDTPHPLNAYGRTKLAGERLARAAWLETLVIRSSWIISGTHPNFVATILRKAREGPVRVVDDQQGIPTVAADLAAAGLQALRKGVSGLLHLTNQGPTTWFGLARKAVELAGLDPELVQPCSSDEYPTQARRPAYSVLGSERRDQLALEGLPAWEESLPGLVEELLIR
ncbi:MAG: dTDP-4-dehydrorhamnose reductase [Acidimicrobiia bacterium]